MKKLIDLSHHNGNIDFNKVKASGIEGVILRAGYGTSIDRKFIEYVTACNKLNIPVGIYWFSYAYSIGMARNEANVCVDVIKPYKITLPVFFDWEQDSWDTAVRNGVTPTVELITGMNRAFCENIYAAGYKAGFYYNEDYRLRKLDMDALVGYYRWHARYKDSISVECDLWQYSASGSVDGINGRVDMDYLVNEALLADQEPVYVTPVNKTNGEVADEVINGLWGNGSERKERLTAAGYDYEKVQDAVNKKLKKSNSQIADEVIAGLWGDGKERKEKLTAAGYNYSSIQKLVNKKLKA